MTSEDVLQRTSRAAPIALLGFANDETRIYDAEED
jgi:hypothetical protein